MQNNLPKIEAENQSSPRKKPMSKDNIREHSAPVYEGIENAPARSMMRATGFKDADFSRPFIGIA
jgi:dihydroxyacid dehydratase/phosphogluconate dehydratase